MAQIINGKEVAQKVRSEIAAEVENMKAKGIVPGLAVVIVGEDPASKVYVRNKKLACAEVGIYSEEYALPEKTSEEELLALIDRLNVIIEIHGILVQAPLPDGFDFKKVTERISPFKDVDAFHPYNVGKIMIGDFDFLPCTPAGVMELLKHYDISVEGKKCVVLG